MSKLELSRMDLRFARKNNKNTPRKRIKKPFQNCISQHPNHPNPIVMLR